MAAVLPWLVVVVGLLVTPILSSWIPGVLQADPLRGSSSLGIEPGALSVIGRKVTLPSHSLGGYVIPRGRQFVYTLNCGGCVNTSTLLQQFSNASLLPIVVVAATEDSYVPQELLARPQVAIVVTDMAGAVVPIDMLKRAPQAALLDESGNIERLWRKDDPLDQFLRSVN